jgi:hypothetical protein
MSIPSEFIQNLDMVAASRALIGNVKEEKSWLGFRKVCVIETHKENETVNELGKKSRTRVTTTAKTSGWIWTDFEKLKAVTRDALYNNLINTSSSNKEVIHYTYVKPSEYVSDPKASLLMRIVNYIRYKIFKKREENYLFKDAMTVTSPSEQGKQQAIENLKDFKLSHQSGVMAEKISIKNPTNPQEEITIPQLFKGDITRDNILFNKQLLFDQEKLTTTGNEGELYKGLKQLVDAVGGPQALQNISALLNQSMLFNITSDLTENNLTSKGEIAVTEYHDIPKTYHIDIEDSKIVLTLITYQQVHQQGQIIENMQLKAPDGYIAIKREIQLTLEDLQHNYIPENEESTAPSLQSKQEILPSLQVKDTVAMMYSTPQAASKAAGI